MYKKSYQTYLLSNELTVLVHLLEEVFAKLAFVRAILYMGEPAFFFRVIRELAQAIEKTTKLNSLCCKYPGGINNLNIV